MNLNRWMLVYLVTGSTFTRWAILAFYGGGLVILAVAILTALILLAAEYQRFFS
jgi:hypothetical protein